MVLRFVRFSLPYVKLIGTESKYGQINNCKQKRNGKYGDRLRKILSN